MSTSKKTYKHIDSEKRAIIRDMLYAGHSANKIAEEIGTSHTTIIREVKRNRVVKIPNIRTANPSLYCKHYRKCNEKCSICISCKSPFTHCKECRFVKCYKQCNKFRNIECDKTSKWPYICPSSCPKRKSCRLPKYSYSPIKAEYTYKKRLKECRSGVNLTSQELLDISNSLKPLLKNGQSPYCAIKALENSVNITERTLYRYIDKGIVDIASIDLPRKVRYKKRKDSKPVFKDKINRNGHTYDDFLALSDYDRNRVCQIDSVEGFKWNKQRLLTMHIVMCEFQFINLVKDSSSGRVVQIFNYYEFLLGSRDLFEKIFGIILADRGREFNKFLELEWSVLEPGKKRCRVYFCDPQRSDQKGSCEKNHEHIRCILPKKYSNFDALTNYDVATINSHINSYARKSLDGNTPINLVKDIVPKSFLDALGIEAIHPKKIVLKPRLLKHTQC